MGTGCFMQKSLKYLQKGNMKYVVLCDEKTMHFLDKKGIIFHGTHFSMKSVCYG